MRTGHRSDSPAGQRQDSRRNARVAKGRVARNTENSQFGGSYLLLQISHDVVHDGKA